MRLIRLTRRGIPILILVISIFCYLSVIVPPTAFWPAAILGYAIPLVIATNISLLISCILLRKKAGWIYLLSVFLALPFISKTYNLTFSTNNVTVGTFTVMSYNAKLFRVEDRYDEFSTESIEWVIRDSSSIKCIQEFSHNDRYAPLDVIAKAERQGYHHHVFQADIEHNPGMAILSKYKIVAKGAVDTNSKSVNNMIYADILIESDTVRVYNVHLKSMRLELSDYSEAAKMRKNYKSLLNKLRFGAIERSKQINKLMKHVEQCSYPILICGDFNETPYSYNYFRLLRNFKNSFEEQGNGFGTTFSHNLLRLRIDHQFTNKSIKTIQYNVDQSITISDHYPSRGTYQLIPSD